MASGASHSGGTAISVLDGAAKCLVSKDKMEVILSPASGELAADWLGRIPAILQEAGIIYGRLPLPEPTSGGWIVARGSEPLNGEDGRIEMNVSAPSGKERPAGDAAGGEGGALYVDLKNLHAVANVRKGEVIARKILPTPGTPGKDVFGEEVAPVAGQPAEFSKGEGTDLSSDGLQLLAALDGRVDVQGQTISVLDHWLIDGSVDTATGNVTFWGRSLEVNGSVLGGFHVSVDGDLEVSGGIENGARIRVGGNLKIGGIIRAEATTVEVGGNLSCFAVEYSTVSVGGNLEVEEYLLDATCDARGGVLMMHGKGLIAGGRCTAGGSIAVNTLGTPANVRTEIRAGYDAAVREMHDKIVQEIKELAGKLRDVEHGLKRLKGIEALGPLDDKKAYIKKRLLDVSMAIAGQNSALKESLGELEARISFLRRENIQIMMHAYPNTLLGVDDALLELSREVEKARVQYQRGQVALIPL